MKDSAKRKIVKIPQFKNEDEEREFWATHSPLDYFDSSSARRVLFPNLKPSLKSISIRLPADMLAELKILANKKDVPYQSLAKIYLARQIALERGTLSRSPGRKGTRSGHTPEGTPDNTTNR
ncbi:MAG: BrnA antitoxin family protein [Desulfomonilaceae bacterium]